MPQMAPISWLILFFIFSIAFMMFNLLNYYCFYTTPKLSINEDVNNKSNNTKNINWKW